MTCLTFHALLGAAETVLTDRATAWVAECCLEPHARKCEACRAHLRRRERLDALARNALLGSALSDLVATRSAASVAPQLRPAWGRPALAVSLAAGLAALLLALPGRHSPIGRIDPGSSARVVPVPRATERDMVAPGNRRNPALRALPAPAPRIATVNPIHRPQRPDGQAPVLQPEIRPAARTASDDVYLDGRDPSRTAEWMTGNGGDRQVLTWLGQDLPPIADDFVQIPLPQFASADPKSPAVRAAVQKYESEARVVDNRLFKKVTLELKARALEELCSELERLTAVRLRPSRGVLDEKVTVFVKERPAREVMRQVARLFGYAWTRSGEPGAYRYELVQDLKSQLAEEEMRSRDYHEALLALDRSMEVYRPHLGLSPAEIRNRAEQASGKERERLNDLFQKWGAVQLYQRLTPAHFTALRQQRQLHFELENSQLPPGLGAVVERSLPAEWQAPLLESAGPGLVRAGQEATASPWLGLEIKQSELGQVTLEATKGITFEDGGGLGSHWTLATGQSPSTARPDNATANATLKVQSPFTRKVSIHPKPSCPKFAQPQGSPTPEERSGITPDALLDRPHVTSADVWEAVHHATGLPIVADAYARLHSAPRVTVADTALFEALCKLGDELRVRWKKDGDYLLGRSTSYFWDKLKEVPNRHLERWTAIRRDKGTLPLETLLEMVTLSDRQLDSTNVGRAAVHCHDLIEWGVFGAGQPRNGYTTPSFARPYYRLLALLTPDQRRAALTPGGLPFTALTPNQQAEMARLQIGLVGMTLHAAYVPEGWYTWEAILRLKSPQDPYPRLPLVSEPTAARALATARRAYPETPPEQIRKSGGILAVWFSGEDGARGFGVGHPPTGFTND